MAEMSPEKKSNALPNALVKDEEEGVAKAAGKLEQPEPRKYKWLAALFMWVAFVSILANGGQAIANATKPVGTHAQKHVYAVGLTSRLNSAGGSVVAMVPCVEVSEAIASLQNGDSDQGLVMVPLPGGEFLTPSMSAAHYQVHEDSFGIEQIFLSGDDDVSYNVSCETSMAACETDPGLSCDVLPSAAVTALSFEDAFDGDFHRLTHRLTHRRLIEAKLPPPPPPPSPSPPPTYAAAAEAKLPPPPPPPQTYRSIQPWDGGQCAMPGQTNPPGGNAYCCSYTDPTLLTKQDCEDKCNADVGRCVAYSWKRSYTDCNLYDAAALPDLAEVVGSRSLSPPLGHWDANCYISNSPPPPSPSPPPRPPLLPGTEMCDNGAPPGFVASMGAWGSLDCNGGASSGSSFWYHHLWSTCGATLCTAEIDAATARLRLRL